MERCDKPGLLRHFQEHYDELRRFLTRRTGSADQAAEVLQDSYFRLADVQASGRPVDSPRAYVLRVVQNLAIDRMRRDRLQAGRGAEAEAALGLADPAPLPDAALLAKERLQLLDDALQEVAPKVRAALLMARLEGLPYARIAERLGVSESMVIKYVAQALRHCRDRLDGS
jgi:RNA polymerase sigma factor (sigma-70 family)